MAKSFEVENKIENFKAHLNIVKEDLNRTTQDLRDVVELKNAHLQEVGVLTDEVSTKQTELLGLRREIEAAKKTLTEKKDEITATVEMHEDVMADNQELLNAFITAKSNLENTIKRLNKEREIAEAKIEDETSQLISLKAAGEIVAIQIDDRVKEKREILSKLEEHILNEELRVKEIANSVNDRLFLADKREQDLVERETKVAQLSEEYHEGHKRLAQKESDIKVIVKRLEKKYEEIFPGRKLTI